MKKAFLFLTLLSLSGCTWLRCHECKTEDPYPCTLVVDGRVYAAQRPKFWQDEHRIKTRAGDIFVGDGTHFTLTCPRHRR